MSRAERKAANAEKVRVMVDSILSREDRKTKTPEAFLVDIRKEAQTYKLEERPLFQRAVMGVEQAMVIAGADMVKVKDAEWLADQKVKQAKERKAKADKGGGRKRRED